MGCDSLLSLFRIEGHLSSKHGDHIVADWITRITHPCRRQRQFVHPLSCGLEWDIANPLSRHPRCPPGNDRHTYLRSYEIDDRVLLLGEQSDARRKASLGEETWDKMLVDAMTMRMVMRPKMLDTIVATNLHADILSDLAAALAGSLGIAPTANLNPERKFPSMFEPIHGSAFDITGKGIANPIGTFWTACMMLDHLGEKGSSARLMRAIERVTADPSLHTPDLGGTATTRRVTDAMIASIQADNQ